MILSCHNQNIVADLLVKGSVSTPLLTLLSICVISYLVVSLHVVPFICQKFYIYAVLLPACLLGGDSFY